MLITSIILALAASATGTYPDGFNARCSDSRTAYVRLDRAAIADPAIRMPAPQPPAAPPATIAIPGYAPSTGPTVTLSYRNGEFSLVWQGIDFQVIETEGKEFRFTVLKATPGDLVLAVQTSSWGVSLSVYHLRYHGDAGALSIATTSYAGHGDDRTSLAVMTCKIGAQSPG